MKSDKWRYDLNETSFARSPDPCLEFADSAPVAAKELGGLIRDHFANGRLFATVGAQGGLLDISYWGRQHLKAAHFFHGDPGTAWVRLFRLCVRVNGKRYYPTLNDTKLYPFGFTSRCEVDGVELRHEMLLLPDALVQRFDIVRNPKRRIVGIEMLHQEAITSTARPNRKWADFSFEPQLNALITSCADENPATYTGGDALAQATLGLAVRDAPRARTWIGLGCDTPLSVRRGYHRRSKYYLESRDIGGKSAAFFLVFANDRPQLEQRLGGLSKSVHRECGDLIKRYEKRLLARPRINVGSPVLNSAFTQYPEVIECLKVPDRPGAVRATLAGYFVWGWDGMMALHSSAMANEPEYMAEILRFFHETRHPKIGLPHQFTTSFKPKFRAPFPAQCQFITGLYHYVATTGDLSVAREVWQTCRFIIDRCRRDEVKGSGLVSGPALWPDFPEAMEENGRDVSSINNSLLYQGLRSMEYLAHALGNAKLAGECAGWAKRLRASFVRYLYDEEKGSFISSCSSENFKPRRHYCCQAVFWLTPFARELVSHAPGRIAKFMDTHLSSDKCLLSLPHWDTAWMADGNQLGSSFPAADSFYLNVHKLTGDDFALKAWLGDVEWFWRRHTAPEAFTPEAENEEALGPDNTGCKQLQACATWYHGLFNSLAGMDFDHEGLTLTPWGDTAVDIRELRLHGSNLHVRVTGEGRHAASLRLNGEAWPPGLFKIPWTKLMGRFAQLELVRGNKAPGHPVIVRADGLSVTITECAGRRLSARIGGSMSGEVAVRTSPKARVSVNGRPGQFPYDPSSETISIPFAGHGGMDLEVIQ